MAAPKTLLEYRDEIALITLNAPEKRNALDLEMVRSLHARIDELAADDRAAAVVLIGAGDKAFAAGADIAELRERKALQALAAINSSLFKRIEDSPWPWIAAVRGYALGGGCELAIACDLRIAGRSAKLGQPEVKLGIIPGAGGTYRLPRLIGLGLARELVYTGRILDAEESKRIGLVNHVVADEELLAEAIGLAGEITANGRLAVRLAKATMNALARPGEGAAVTVESVAQALLFESEDKHRRMDAFLQRRSEQGR